MKRLCQIPLLTLAIMVTLLIVIAACSDSAPAPAPAATETQAAPQTAPADAPSEQPATQNAPVAASDCQVGQALSAQDRCTYPGTSDEFSVDASGTGSFLFLTAATVINARNALINGQPYDFAASRQDDGSWIIEVVGDASASIPLSAIVKSTDSAATPTAVSTPMPTSTPLPAQASPPAPMPTLAPVQTPTAMPTSTPLPAPTSTPSPEPTFAPTATPQAAPTSMPTPAPAHSPTPTAIPPATPTAMPTPAPTPMPALTHGPNRPPQVVAAIPAQTVRVYESIVLDIAQAFHDPEGNQVAGYKVILSDSSLADSSVDTGAGKLTLSGSMEGETWVTLTACDSGGCSNLGDLTFMLTVAPPPNRPPQAVHTVSDQAVRVGESISLPVKSAFWDVEGDRIVDYEFSLSDESLASGAINDVGRITLQGTRQGTTTVSVSACDSHACGSELALKFALRVLPPPNRAPEVVASIADRTVRVGDLITIDLAPVFQDPDGDDIQEYRFSHTNRDVITGFVSSSINSLTLQATQVGTTNVAVEASDGELRSNRADATFMLKVIPPQGYLPRVVNRTSDQRVDVGETLYIEIWRAFDAPERHKVIRYDYLIRKDGVARKTELSPTGVMTLIGADEGSTWISARACNTIGCSEFSDMEFVLTVKEPKDERNHKPEVVAAIPDRNLMLGESFRMDVSSAFNDPDEDDAIVDYEFTLSEVAVARGTSISDTGILILHGTHVGKTTVSVYACDTDEECSNARDLRFTLTVTKPDDSQSAPPVAQR